MGVGGSENQAAFSNLSTSGLVASDLSRAIDARDFATHYSGYLLELEADIEGKGKISAKFTPVQLQQLSEATQNANEFRKYVVEGYNSCAITKADYGRFGAKSQALDGLAREITDLAEQRSVSAAQRTRLDTLIRQYGDLARKLSTD